MEPGHAAHSGRPRRKRVLLITGLVFILLLGVFTFFLPYLLKLYIERHSVEWVGRKITIDHIILNPFTFTYAVNGVRCNEPGSNEVFFSWKSVSVKSRIWRGFVHNDWRFRQLRIEDPYFHIVQRGSRFNFSDLMELGGRDTTSSTDTSHIHFSMEDIRITGGRINYSSDILKAPVAISGLHAECTRITTESARMDFQLGLTMDQGGTLNAGFKIDTEKSRYAVHAALESFALAQLLPYLQDFMHTTGIQGDVDVRLDLENSWADTTALAVSGDLAMENLSLTNGEGQPLVGLKSGSMSLDTLNGRTQSFKISKVLVDGLTTRYQQWGDGSNTWTKALKLDSTSTGDSVSIALSAEPSNLFVLLADYVSLLGKGFAANAYTADSMVMVNGSVEFEDFTPEKPFRYQLDKITIRCSPITTAKGTADFFAAARLNGRGQATSSFKFDPKDFRNVDATLHVKDLFLPDLDAYSRWYGAYPIHSGILDHTDTTSIHGGIIDSRNALQVKGLRFGKKTDVHDTGIYVLPLPLACSLLKDVHGNIDLDIPVKGDLNDPGFKVWPVVWKVLGNLVAKAAAAPVKLVSGKFSTKDSVDLEEVRFASLSTAIGKDQRLSLNALAGLLEQKTELNVALVPVTDIRQEMEEWASSNMKMEYLGLASPLGKADSVRVANLALRDTAFLVFLDTKSPNSIGRPERERCLEVLGVETAKQAVHNEELARQSAVMTYLKNNGVEPGRITFRAGTAEEVAGRKGEPGYRFVVYVSDDANP